VRTALDLDVSSSSRRQGEPGLLSLARGNCGFRSDHEIVVAFAGRVFRMSEMTSVHANRPRLTLDLLVPPGRRSTGPSGLDRRLEVITSGWHSEAECADAWRR
jgi:hypothetical protein